MFKNYFITALRNIMKSKLYTFLNIIGLAIGLVGVILITLYVYNELTYDHYHQNYRQIYRLASHYTLDGKAEEFAASSFPIGQLFKQEYSEIEDVVKLIPMSKTLFKRGDTTLYIKDIQYATPNTTTFFTHEFICGNPKTALEGVNKIILSQSMAKRFFGDENPLNQTITSGKGKVFQVTGVYKDFPDNVHVKYDALIGMANYLAFYANTDQTTVPTSTQNPYALYNIDGYTYLSLKENTDFSAFKERTKSFFPKYMAQSAKMLNAGFSPLLQPLPETHFTKLIWDMPQGKKEYITIFIIIGVFLLVIACINYMNLATARSARRAKEVGLRKVVGAQRSQLIRQFLFESVIMAFIALIFAFIITEAILPIFNQLAGKKLTFGFGTPIWIYMAILAITFLIGIISGCYPAFYLSSFQPAIVIKGEVTKGIKGKRIREILVVFQFALSVIMIISTFVVVRQMNFLRKHDLGFNKDNVLIIEAPSDSTYVSSYGSFRQELLKYPQFKAVATAGGYAFGEKSRQVFCGVNNGKLVKLTQNYMIADSDFLTLMDIRVVYGENFADNDQRPSELQGLILNEAAIRSFGWPANALNQKITMPADPRVFPIRAITADFNHNTLHNPIEPLLIFPSNEPQSIIYIRISGEEIQHSLELLQSTWASYFPAVPLEYQFMADNIESQYEAESHLSKIFGYFSMMCIFIACLGLLGLATYAAQQRTKEIGIRKVMGGSIRSIVFLLTKDFSQLVLISNIIAWPVAFLAMNYWLGKFTYHIGMPYFMFILATIIAFLIAWCTVGFIAFKTAKENPVTSLRYE